MTIPSGLHEDLIYLDYNATTPVDPRVAEVFLPYVTEHFGNPSSTHPYGHAAHTAVTTARATVATLLDTTPEEIVFTGSGSEANTLAIRGAALANRDRGNHIITQATEHPAVLAACDALARLHGFRITRLPVDRDGLVDPADLDAALTPDTVLVTIMHANNETGTIQPIRELAARAHAHGALFHTDASQTVGKIPVSVRDLGVDLLTVTGHKMYAPKGIGALHVHNGLHLEPAIYGGGQERAIRAGTENVAHIAALGHAAHIAATTLADESDRIRRLRDLLHHHLEQRLPGRIHLNGHPTARLPNTLNLSIDGTIGHELLAATPGLAASTGSACHEADTHPHPYSRPLTYRWSAPRSSVRLTLGRWTTVDDISHAATLLTDAVRTIDHI
jgi:cysteine desulfurase